MPTTQPLPLLGGLTPQQFMKRHWQKKPLLVRQAWPGVAPPIARSALFDRMGGIAGHGLKDLRNEAISVAVEQPFDLAARQRQVGGAGI